MYWLTLILRMIIFVYCGYSVAAFRPPVSATRGMVISDHYLASAVGASVLKKGGNAMDAAVAVGYALAVVHPCCGNIGGGGFMLVHWHTGENSVLDFREVAPEKTKSDLFFRNEKKLKKRKELGYLLVGVPGTVMGLDTALKKYGTWSRQKVMAPAIQLAEKGFVLNHDDVKNFTRLTNETSLQPNVKAIFMPHGHILRPGQRFVQKALAQTLKRISQHGTAEFYQGSIAKNIVAASRKDHGVLSLDDFKNYQVIWRDPIHCLYRGYTILTAPPPSAGVTICEILKIVSGFPIGRLGFHSADAVNINVEAMRQAFYDRNHYLGDPRFVSNPVNRLLSDKHIQQIQHKITQHQHIPLSPFKKTNSHMYTTHFVVMDDKKNVVNITYTINSFYGVMRMANQEGFFLNNELRDFALKKGRPNIFMLVQGKKNLIAPNKRPLSSMSPTLVMKNNQVYMALGAAGGPTILTTIVQAIENVLDYGMDIRAANDSPRYHMQWRPDVIYWEPFGFSRDTRERLQAMGYQLQQHLFGRYLYWGQLNSLLVASDGVVWGASDNRQPNGRALGISEQRQGYSLENKTFAQNEKIEAERSYYAARRGH